MGAITAVCDNSQTDFFFSWGIVSHGGTRPRCPSVSLRAPRDQRGNRCTTMENPVKTKISTTCLTPAGPLSSGEERRKKKCVLVWLDGWLASLRKFRISSLCGSTRRWRESSTHVSRHPKGDKPVEMAYDTVLGLKREKKNLCPPLFVVSVSPNVVGHIISPSST